MADGEDPFGSLMKIFRLTSSSELQSCSFAQESETFPDDFDSLATASMDSYPLEPDGIVIASPQEIDSGNNAPTENKSDTEENEDFLTPPEHHNPSTSSSLEDPQRLRAVTPSVSEVSVTVVVETTAGDDERAEDEASVDFEKGEITPGFSAETEKIDTSDEVSGGQCSDSVKGVGEIEGFERELKRFGGFGTKMDKTISKKIRVSEDNGDSEMRTLCIDGTKTNENVNDSETIDLETEDIDEAGEFYVGKITTDGDTPADDTENVGEPGESWESLQKVSDATAETVEEAGTSGNYGSDGDVDHSEKEMHTVCIDGMKINENVNDSETIDLETEEINEAGEFHVGKITTDGDSRAVDTEKVTEPGESWENVQKVSDATAETVEEAGKSGNYGSDGDVDHSKKEMRTVCIDGMKINENVNDSETIDMETEEIDEAGEFYVGKITTDGDRPVDDTEKVIEPGESWENVQKVSDATVETVEEAGKSGNRADVDHSEKEKGVDLNEGDKCLKVNGNLVLEEFEEGVRDNSNNEDGTALLGSRSKKKHRKYRCGRPGNGVDISVKERVVRSRHILTSSIKEEDTGGDKSIINTEEVEKSKNSGSCNDINQREKDQDVDHSAMETVPRIRSELPSSIRGKEKVMGGEENRRYVKLKKDGSWKDIVDALEAVFGKVDDDNGKKRDILDTADKRGLTFPKARWKHRKYRCGRPGNGVDISGVVRSRHILTSSIKEEDTGGDKNIINTEEVEKSKNSGSCNDINQREKGQDVDHSAMVTVPRIRRELPSSIRGKEKDMGGEEYRRYVKVKKDGSWKNIVDALEAVFGKVDDDNGSKPEILGAATRRVLTYPKPRWSED
ncbi:hypothetical protein M9H77_32972 [Catharanthus roseus]|uniref:Uncharacterized protein n=1 Tax=Catharanthus roseus TaxID=4058 RepID=A0ACC0A5U9_CATRO|nr:hypothetical protein M9H77_32972 [Catharanthus roseus]